METGEVGLEKTYLLLTETCKIRCLLAKRRQPLCLDNDRSHCASMELKRAIMKRVNINMC